MYTTVDIRKLQDRIDEITNKTEVIESEEIAELEGATWPKSDDDESAPQVGDTVMHDKHGLVKVLKISDTDVNMEPAEYIIQTKSGNKRVSYDQLVMGESVDEASPEEVTNTGREEDEATRAGRLDRDNIKLDDVKPAIEKLLAEYENDADEWHDRYNNLEKGLRQKGLTDPNAIQMKIYDMDDDIVSYVNIDDLEDKIEALERLMKTADADGNDIVQTAEFGVGDTVPQEELMRDIKAAIKQDHPEVYSKLFMYDIDESAGVTERVAKEGDAELDELKGMLGRSGVMGFTN